MVTAVLGLALTACGNSGQKSSLAISSYLLSVTDSGAGAGTVSSSPPGINCSSACSYSFNSGISVTLTATPSAGSTFAGWSGDCAGTGTCTVTMSAAKSVTATFGTVATAAMIPLIDMTASDDYLGFQGGLYQDDAGNPTNAVPSIHDFDGLTLAGNVQPLDANGSVNSATGKIVMMAVGMSHTTQEWCANASVPAETCNYWSFTGQALASPSINKTNLVLVDGAIGGEDAIHWIDPDALDYASEKAFLARDGLTANQVQIIWLKQADAGPTVSLKDGSGADAYALEGYLGQVLRAIKVNYPNVKMVFLASRSYAGYATSTLNPEPYAYESGFAVKWLIQAQLNQMKTGVIDPIAGDLSYSTTYPNTATTAWIAWGPYFWADGTTPRSDGLTWQYCDFVASDHTHPSPDFPSGCLIDPNQSGEHKAGNLLLDFFLNSPYTQSWFTTQTP